MAGFNSFADITDDKLHYSTFRKTTASVATSLQWYDDSMLAGFPPANFYASEPLVAATLAETKGIRHWPSPTGGSEHLLTAAVWGNAGTLEAPASFLLCDWLLYYPFLDGDSTDAQVLDNTVTLPRYASGVGVQCFIVALGPGTTTGAYSMSYTNSDGTAGRTATGTTPTPASAASILTTGGGATNRVGPFVGLQSGDVGIRSVEQITWTTPPGGISAIVLVKPLASFLYAEIGTMAETNFYPRFPRIEDGAYLNLLRHQVGATPVARTFGGLITTIRS